MRIVAGELRGRTIEAPAGDGTRPTTDRVREALMSSLYSLRGGFEDAIVLDAFAGSGALGLEALSRGAASCRFFERDARAQTVLARNIAALKIPASRAQVSRADVLVSPPERHRPAFNLVFFDPPYATDPTLPANLAARLRAAGALASDALVVYEHARKDADAVAAALEAAGYSPVKQKTYGKTGVVIARLASKDAPAYGTGATQNESAAGASLLGDAACADAPVRSGGASLGVDASTEGGGDR